MQGLHSSYSKTTKMAVRQSEMKVRQINLNHCEAAQDLMWHDIAKIGCDVAIISEPYKVPPDNPNWVADKASMAAIYVCGKYPIQQVVSKDNEGFVVAKINGIYFCSCYAPPRWTINEYDDMLDELIRVLRNRRPVVIAGDFNAWATEWGSRRTDLRGQSTLEALAHLDVLIANEGNESTYSRDGRESVIDVTFCSPSLMRGMNWRINQEDNGSDHKTIEYEIRKDLTTVPSSGNQKCTLWKTKELNKELLTGTFELLVGDRRNHTPEELTKIITSACDVSMPRRIVPRYYRKPAYWWNDEIAKLRAECNKARRQAQRAQRLDVRRERMAVWRKKREELTIAIKESKKRKFRELCDAIDDNPWGDGYRIVMTKLKGITIPRETCPEKLKKAVEVLFPQHEKVNWTTENNNVEVQITEREVTKTELVEEAVRLQANKAPGPDGIPNEVLKILVKKHPETFRAVFQRCMQQSKFPDIWKRQKLVLIPKPGKPLDDPSSLRPLGLLDGPGKLLERIILNRLITYAEGERGLSENQFGFRRGRSTVDAITLVTKKAEESIKNSTRFGRYCAVTTIDVKNAFNSASWVAINQSLEEIGVSGQLCKMIRSYLTNRVLLYDTEGGQVTKELTAGVPQGSILGPILWNIMYDGLLRLQLPEGAEIVGFADDVVVLVKSDTVGLLESAVVSIIEQVQRWLTEHKLQMAQHKTEIVVVTNRRKPVTAQLDLGGNTITSKRYVKYLGVMIDDRLNSTSHVDYVCEKAGKVQTTLARLMPNTVGARNDKRRLLANVITSVIRYGDETWVTATEKDCNRRKLDGVYRLAALRVVSAYRTVSTDAVCVIAGMIPICTLIREDRRCGESRRRIGITERPLHREQTMSEWQAAWDASDKGRWTHRLIPRIKPWMEREHGGVGYHLSQFLTGHGAFGSYLYRIGKADTPNCLTCAGGVEESPEHAIFVCPRYNDERVDLASGMSTLSADNLIARMCANKDFWSMANAMITRIVTRLDEDHMNSTV